MSRQAALIDSLLTDIRVLPAVVIEDANTAVPLAEALLAGGIRAIEVTLRSDAALESVKAIAAALPDMLVGTGTVLTPDDLTASLDAGARFAVSPGLTPMLAEAATDLQEELPLLPGSVTASEVMFALEHGFERLKFFPAGASGGASAVKALHGPLPAASFCTTGGIAQKNAPDYLELPNVFCVGGSWLTPQSAIDSGDWAEITALAQAASGL